RSRCDPRIADDIAGIDTVSRMEKFAERNEAAFDPYAARRKLRELRIRTERFRGDVAHLPRDVCRRIAYRQPHDHAGAACARSPVEGRLPRIRLKHVDGFGRLSQSLGGNSA